jgi:hypothetical protein
VTQNIDITEVIELALPDERNIVWGLGLWSLTPLSTIFQLYRTWWSVLLVGEIGVPGENHQPVASH